MNDSSKDYSKHEICHHSFKSERDYYKVCPSKLSKRELQELYFSLLDNNIELKQTVNSQRDDMKVLNTRLQRMTAAQKAQLGKENKDCCATTKAVITEQKDSIAELKKANERMAERIRHLNMRLCSAKQFLRTGPPSRKISTGVATRALSSTTSFNEKKKYVTTQAVKNSISCQCTDDDLYLVVTPKTEPTKSQNDGAAEKLDQSSSSRECYDNRCKTEIEDLKQKIINLQEELHRTKAEYRMRQECTQREGGALTRDLSARLQEAQNRIDEQEIQLTLEKKKVAELMTHLKAAQLSNQVAKAIETHLTSVNEENPDNGPEKREIKKNSCHAMTIHLSETEDIGSPEPDANKETRLLTPEDSPVDIKLNKTYSTVFEETTKTDASKTTDDSGYTDHITETEKGLTNTNPELMQRIADIQAQLDQLKRSADNCLNKNQPQERYVEQNIIDFDTKINCMDTHSVLECINKNNAECSTISSKWDKNLGFNTKEQRIPLDNIEEINGNVTNNDDLDDIKSQFDHFGFTHRGKQIQMDRSVSTVFEGKQKPHFLKSASNESNKSVKIENHNKYQIPGPAPIDKYNRDSIEMIKKTPKKPITASGMKKVSYDMATIQAGDSLLKTMKRLKTFSTQTDNEENVDSNENVQYIKKNIESKEQRQKTHTPVQNDADKVDNDLATSTDLYTSDEAYLNITQNASSGLNIDKNVVRGSTNNDGQDQILDTAKTASKKNLAGVVWSKSEINRKQSIPSERKPKQTLWTAEEILSMKSDKIVANQPPNVVDKSTESLNENVPDFNFKRKTSSFSTQQNGKIKNSIDITNCPKSSSPDNTDHEISTMTDLPSEQECTSSPRQQLSPGEDKWTSTYTDSYNMTSTNDYETLSEGELPGIKNEIISPGETGVDRKSNNYNNREEEGPANNMQDTLQAIAQELARCRHLLQQTQEESEIQYQKRIDSVDVGSLARMKSTTSILLSKTEAKPCLPDVPTQKCKFILHIGTIVLCDEAVISSTNKPLILMWKFFDQSMTMTRIPPGRVVHFDFSTNYDVNITDELITYLKFEEMPIFMCELDKHDEYFAKCSLPLRDALLHINRRADMSLALEVGPHLKNKLKTDPLDSGDEVGVLDLWCMLVSNQNLLIDFKTPSKGSTQMANIGEQSNGRNDFLKPINDADDDVSSDRRVSKYLDLGNAKPTVACDPQEKFYDHYSIPGTDCYTLPKEHQNVEKDHTDLDSDLLLNNLKKESHEVARKNEPLPKDDEFLKNKNLTRDEETAVTDSQQAIHFNHQFDNQRMSSHWDKMCIEPGMNNSMQSAGETSGIVFNEVNAKIRNINDMKKMCEDKVDTSSITNVMVETANWNRVSNLIPERESGSEQANLNKKSVKIGPVHEKARENSVMEFCGENCCISVTILWLELNEASEAGQMNEEARSNVSKHMSMDSEDGRRVFVAYSFLGRDPAELETPLSLPKPKHSGFILNEKDIELLGHMARCRSPSNAMPNPNDCIVFTVVSEPPDDPLGIESCEDIGLGYLYLGNVLARAAGDASVEQVQVRTRAGDVAGTIAVRLDGLHLLRRCKLHTSL